MPSPNKQLTWQSSKQHVPLCSVVLFASSSMQLVNKLLIPMACQLALQERILLAHTVILRIETLKSAMS